MKIHIKKWIWMISLIILMNLGFMFYYGDYSNNLRLFGWGIGPCALGVVLWYSLLDESEALRK